MFSSRYVKLSALLLSFVDMWDIVRTPIVVSMRPQCFASIGCRIQMYVVAWLYG